MTLQLLQFFFASHWLWCSRINFRTSDAAPISSNCSAKFISLHCIGNVAITTQSFAAETAASELSSMLHFYFHDIISIDCICNSFNVSIATIVLHCSPLFVVALLLSIMPRYHQFPFSSHSEDTRLSDFLRCFALQFIGARDWRPKTLFDDQIINGENGGG